MQVSVYADLHFFFCLWYFAEAVTGKDMLTGEEVNLLSRVLGALPFVKSAYRGAKTTIKIVKKFKKGRSSIIRWFKIALKSDEVTKFEKQAKEAKIKNKGEFF